MVNVVRMTNRNRFAILLALISLGLLWPGLTQPALTIKATMEMFGTTRELTNETRSVVGAIQSLRASGNLFVAGLILLFSVLVPVIKAALLLPIFAMRGSTASHRMYSLVQIISKWSMADVFAVGMLIALLVAKGTANLSAIAGPGFYFFAAYCLVSNAAFQLLRIDPQAATRA
jgi:paraquat-inducible protein A